MELSSSTFESGRGRIKQITVLYLCTSVMDIWKEGDRKTNLVQTGSVGFWEINEKRGGGKHHKIHSVFFGV